MVSAIEPGPLNIGIASGVREMSLFARASSRRRRSPASSGGGASMDNAIPETSTPPAMRMPGMEMPKKRMMKLPEKRQLTKMTTM